MHQVASTKQRGAREPGDYRGKIQYCPTRPWQDPDGHRNSLMALFADAGALARAGRTVMRRRWMACVAVVMVSVGVVACSGGGGGGTSVTSSASGSGASVSASASVSIPPSASPTPSALPSLSPELQALRDEAMAMPKPERYEGMDEFSTEGAVLSADYFLSLFPYVYATGDLADWESLSEDGCVFCSNVMTDVTARLELGWWSDPWEQEVVFVSCDEAVGDPSTMVVDVNVISGEIVTHRADGIVERRRPPQDTEPFTLQMHWNGESWNVAEGAAE